MKQISLKLAFMALCWMMGMSAMAQTTVVINGLKYGLNGTEAYVWGYEGSPTDVVIPATIESDGLTFKVTKISSKAFFRCTSLTSVRSVGENLKYIGNNYDVQGCFEYCTSLESVYFPSVTNIGAYAFEDCTSLPYIVLPSGCTIDGKVFQGCSRLQAIIYLGNQTDKGGSNATVYNVNNMVTWSESCFPYTGNTPTATFTNNLPMGFQPTNAGTLQGLEKNVGSYSTTVPITFSNGDQEFTVDIPYNYTITPAQLTARVKDATRLYGDPNPQFEAEYTGFVSGENASVITNQGTYATTAIQKSDVGTYEVKLQGASAKNYTFQYESGTLTVTKAPLTITPRDKTMTYGDRVPNLEVDYAGLKNNESKPVWVTEPTVATEATQQSAAGSYLITVTGGEAKNYNLTRKNGLMTINKASLTATTKNATRQYGDENPDFELSYSGLKNNETEPVWTVFPNFVTGATKTSPVGNYGITASGGEAKNYVVQYINNGQLTVTKAQLTATARSYTKYQGESNPRLEVDYDGFKNNETKLALEQEAVASTTCTLNSRPGTYPITVSGGLAINYDFTYVNGTLTVVQKEDLGDATANTLSLPNITGNKGHEVILPIALTNENAITGLQIDLYLPDGVTVATNNKGKMLVETTSRMQGNYAVTGNVIDNFVRITGYSAESEAFTGSSGNILNVTLNVANDVADGDYSVWLRDIVLSDVNNKEYRPADAEGTITVMSYLVGDVDNSGAANINDVVCIVNYILNKPNGVFIEAAADVDNSGTININDVVTLVNRYILHRNTAPKHAPRFSVADDNYLHLGTINIKPGETIEVPMLLTNSDEVRAVQGNITLPAGLSFVNKSNGWADTTNINDRSEDFTLSCSVEDDGSLSFAQYSIDGFCYDGTDGGIFKFKIKADANAAPGRYDVVLKDVVLSINGVGYDIADRTSQLYISGGATGIEEIDYSMSASENSVYDLQGRKIWTDMQQANGFKGGVRIVRLADGNTRKVVVK